MDIVIVNNAHSSLIDIFHSTSSPRSLPVITLLPTLMPYLQLHTHFSFAIILPRLNSTMTPIPTTMEDDSPATLVKEEHQEVSLSSLKQTQQAAIKRRFHPRPQPQPQPPENATETNNPPPLAPPMTTTATTAMNTKPPAKKPNSRSKKTGAMGPIPATYTKTPALSTKCSCA